MTTRRRILLAEIEPRVPRAPIYATWSPTDRAADIALSGGNLTATKSTTHASNWAAVRGTTAMPAGQWYWEVTVAFSGSADFAVGIDPGSGLSNEPPVRVNRAGAVHCYGVLYGSVGAAAAGDVIRLWLDTDSTVLRVARNSGAWVGVTGNALQLVVVNGALPIAGFLRPAGSTVSLTANFGATPFAFPVPAGAAAGVYAVVAPSSRTVYVASEGINTGASDTPESTHYSGRIAGDSDVEFARELSVVPWGESVAARGGSLTLVNRDGALDEWLAWQWRDAPFRLYAGYEGDARSAYTLWSSGVCDRIENASNRRLQLTLADPLVLLDRAIQPATYPDDQPNAQAAGQPLPIVIGRPLYCEGVLLDTNPTARDYQLHDGVGSANVNPHLAAIDAIYDMGDRLAGPDDPYAPSSPITAANGGNFTGWAGSPAVPSNWAAITPFSATNRFFAPVGGIGAVCQSDGAGYAVMYHGASVLQPGRYVITFDVQAVTKAGTLYFRVDGGGGVRADTSIALTTTGAKSLTLDVRKAGQLQIAAGNLFGPDLGLNADIRNLRVNSTQIIDWDAWTDPDSGAFAGFHLRNKPAGKVVANPVGPSTPGLRGTVAEYPDSVLEWLRDRAWSAYGAAAPAWDAVNSPQALAAAAPWRLASYLRQPVSLLALLRQVMDSLLGGAWVTRAGALAVAVLSEPDPAAIVLTLDDTNVIGDVSVSIDTAKSLTRRIAGRRNHSPHTDADIVLSATPALRAELMAEWGYTTLGARRVGVQTGLGDATLPLSAAYAAAWAAPARGTLLQEVADIDACGNRGATLWRPVRAFYDLSAVLDASTADALEPGQSVRLVWPRIRGLAGGGLVLKVVRVRSRFFSRRVDLRLWGCAPPLTAS